jgi:hypothetical protein
LRSIIWLDFSDQLMPRKEDRGLSDAPNRNIDHPNSEIDAEAKPDALVVWHFRFAVDRPEPDLEATTILRDNRRMTDAAHNQHSGTRRPSDRDRIVTQVQPFPAHPSRSVALR